jgi:myo-inositol catabolism protein IolC
VFWGPCTGYLKGNVDRGAAVDTMAASYLDLIAQWSARVVAGRD